MPAGISVVSHSYELPEKSSSATTLPLLSAMIRLSSAVSSSLPDMLKGKEAAGARLQEGWLEARFG